MRPSGTNVENVAARKLSCFVSLSSADRRVLDAVTETRRYVEPHTDLIREGDNPTNAHLVLDGFAIRYKILSNGSRQILAHLIPGDFCDLHVFLLRAMDHSIASLTRCSVVDIPRTTVVELLSTHPNITVGLLMATLVDEGTLREWLANIGRRTAPKRIAHLLCELLVRLQAIGRANNDTFALPLRQAEIADTLGLTSVHCE